MPLELIKFGQIKHSLEVSNFLKSTPNPRNPSLDQNIIYNMMLRHFTIARILKCHFSNVSVGNRGLSDIGTFFNVKFLSQEICVRCWDMSEVEVSL